MAGVKRRSTRQAASRKRSIYAEPDTDDEFEAVSEGEYQPEELPETSVKKRKVTKSRKSKPQTRSKTKSKQTVKSMFKVGKARRSPSKASGTGKAQEGFTGPSDERSPQWTLLPVDILRDIFVFASQPLHDFSPESSANATWLLKAARSCRAFALPALEAYYYSPALLTTDHPHYLLELLQIPDNRRYIDYNVKIKSFHIDVRSLAYVAHNKPPFELGPLIAQLPQLQHMEIVHPMYEPPYRPMKIQKWTFSPLELFEIMDQYGVRLRTWRWSRDMIPRNASLDLYATILAAHQSKALSRLETLTVCGFNYADSSEPGCTEEAQEISQPTLAPPGLATSIATLPNLRDLSFISCDVVMNMFLLRLPNNLQRLELSNCLEITSSMLHSFFQSSGSQLRELVLNHNAALNLSFLQGLKTLTPRLEVLKVDLRYYSERFTVNDAIALYDELLSEDETPTWPSNLRHLEILHAQKWSPEAAQNLFRSLLESAPTLLNLRYLVLHAHINIPWRDRVGFRDQWIERLTRVYLSQPEKPSEYLGSLKQYRLWKQRKRISLDEADELGNSSLGPHDRRIRRQLSHVQVSPRKSSGDTDIYSDSEEEEMPTKRQPRRSKRVAESQIAQASNSATTEEEEDVESENSSDESDEQDWRKQPEKFIQGLCKVVDITIDNQRPRENQWTEGDFLDSEVSGDEDWQEGADSGPEDSYAW